MKRRLTRDSGLLLSLLLLLGTLLGAAALAACGGGTSPTPGGSETATTAPPQSPSPSTSASPSPSPSPTSATSAVLVYFLRGEKLGVAERRVPRTTAVAKAALTALCGGPNAEEQDAGLGTAVPADAELRGVSVKNGVATVDLSSEYAGGGGSLSMTARVAQVVYTLTQFPTIKSVSFALDGKPITTLGGEGVMVSPPQTRADWVGFEPAIFVERPGVGATLTSPFALSGTASVFEGSFQAELLDDAGGRITRATIQASAGGPERGDFRKAVSFTTGASSGELVVYSLSMEDGARQNEVRIPVTFAR